jgi:hypothetical protein
MNKQNAADLAMASDKVWKKLTERYMAILSRPLIRFFSRLPCKARQKGY